MTDPQPDPVVEPDEGSTPDAAPPTEPPAELTVESLVEALETVARQRDEHLATAQRIQADFENHRKQAQRRSEDQVQREVAALVEHLLPVLDACDGAIAHGATEVEPIASALLLTLEKEGLARIDPAGQPFDPAEADAVVHEPGTGGEHIVAEVLRPGYSWRGRVLRPAMVRVTD